MSDEKTLYSDIFEEIKDSASLVDEIESKGVIFSNSGGNKLKCCCPFPDHDDGSPSFFVTLDNDPELFYCFGCKRSGSIIDFVMYYGDGLKEMSLREAIEYLIKKYEIESDVFSLDRIDKIPNKYKRDELPLFSKSLLISEEIRDFLHSAIDLESDFHKIESYLKNIDVAFNSKDYPTIEMYDEIVPSALKGIRKKDVLFSLSESCRKCIDCDLSDKCSTPLPSFGRYKSKMFILGGKVTIEEILSGELYSNTAGKFLRRIIGDISDNVDLWFSKAIHCFSEEDLDVENLCVCSNNYLFKEIAEIKPSVILVLGEIAKNVLLPEFSGKAIDDLWGKKLKKKIVSVETNVVFNIDPQRIVSSGGLKSPDFDKFKRTIEGALQII